MLESACLIGRHGGDKTGARADSFIGLRREDSSWDYRGEFTKGLTHGFHPYPAMMIPQVARRLIESYSRPGDTILDPFCGSGSVLVEAKVLGRNSWGGDLNPVALLIARAKTTPVDPQRLREEYCRLLETAYALDAETLVVPSFFNVEYWFKTPVALALARIKHAVAAISGSQNAQIREFFLVAFSETVRLSSNSRNREFKLFRYPPEKLEAHYPDPLAIFRKKVEKNIEGMRDFYLACQGRGADPWCRPLMANAIVSFQEIPPASVDAVVTSPPYGDSRTTVAYGQFSRLSAQWLGFDDLEARMLDGNLMGGRPLAKLDYPRCSPTLAAAAAAIAETDQLRARQVLGFYLDLEKALQNVIVAVRPGGYVCIVIGNRRVKRVQLPTDLIIAEMGASRGLVPEKIIVRNIPSKTMPLQNSPTNVAGDLEPTMHREYIVVMRKPS